MDRLPPISSDKVEADCYPRANSAQAYHVLKHKTSLSLETQHVILSFDLNNREEGNPVLLRKSLERLQGAAIQTFPNAVVHVTLINYDKALAGWLV